MRKISSLRKRLGTVAMEYVIILGTSVIMSGLATGTAIAAMQYQAVADLTAASMSADFTQASAEATTASNVLEYNKTNSAIYGSDFQQLAPVARTNSTVESAQTTTGPERNPITGSIVMP